MKRFATAIFGAVMLATASSSSAETLDQHGLPAFDAEMVVKLVKDAISNGPPGRLVGVTIYSVEQVRLMGHSSARPESGTGILVVDANNPRMSKNCEALAMTTVGARRVSYRFQWRSDRNRTLWLQARLMPTDYIEARPEDCSHPRRSVIGTARPDWRP